MTKTGEGTIEGDEGGLAIVCHEMMGGAYTQTRGGRVEGS